MNIKLTSRFVSEIFFYVIKIFDVFPIPPAFNWEVSEKAQILHSLYVFLDAIASLDLRKEILSVSLNEPNKRFIVKHQIHC